MTQTGLAIPLDKILSCFEGLVPCTIGTVGVDGMPNVTYLSVVHRVDDNHVALSRQFFRKTDENTIANPFAHVLLIEPETGRQFLLSVVYERTETEGPLFERMRTKLDAVAAHEGMSNIFVLKGTDICRVERIEMMACKYPEGPPPRTVSIEKVEAFSRMVSTADDMEELFRITLAACSELLGYRHAFIMLVDESGDRLYTVASAGYASPGTGSEVRMGEGLIGIAASRRQSVRVTHMTRDVTYSHAAHDARQSGDRSLEHVIPLPGLASIQSQLVTPMLAHRELVGVICLQSETPGAFQAADECVVGILANQLAMAMAHSTREEPPAAEVPATPTARAVHVKHYSEDDSVFLDNEYLIKGVAGAILWRLLNAHATEGREEFSNKEIRLDQSIDLPDIKDNLEARLILLRRRLEERCDYLRIEKVARGRFRLVVGRPLDLVTVEGGGPL